MMSEQWPVKSLSEVTDFIMGQAPKSDTYTSEENGTRLTLAGDFGELRPSPSKYTTNPLKFGEEGDVFICVVGATSGKVNLGVDASITRSIAALRPKDAINQKFLYYFLQSKYDWINKIAEGSAQPILNRNKLAKIFLPIPSKKEQQRIVSILDDAFANIDLYLTKLQQKILSPLELFQSHLNRLFDSKDEHWNEHTLEEISEALITKGATPTTYGFPFVDEGISFLRSECVSDHGFEPNGIRYISEEANQHMKRSIVKGGDVLISITGYLGRIVRYPSHMDDGNINQHIARVRINNENINPDFIVYQLQSERIQSHYRDVYTGTAQPLLSLKQIRETVVFIPPIAVQNEIIDRLNNFYLQTRELEVKYQTGLDSLAELKQSILQEAFSGKLTGGIDA